MFSADFVRSSDPWGSTDCFARRDGQHYKQIVEKGYDYRAGKASVVAFFPAYPLASRALAALTGLDAVPAMLAVSNLSLLAAFVLLGFYLQSRRVGGIDGESESLGGPRRTGVAGAAQLALISMAVFPTTFFFRMAYSESLFMFLCILLMLGVARMWRLPMLAFIAGLATAVRPVGVALLIPLVWHVARTSGSKRDAVRRLAYAIPLGCWGLIAYMAFQHWKFGEPFAFAITQQYWRVRAPGTGWDKLVSLVTWEPVWNVYHRWSPGDWQQLDGGASALFSLQFANPVYFVGTAALIAIGARKKWLNSYEILLSVGLLAIPYVTRAYEMCMASQGRFAAVVFPAYIVMGQLLARLPTMVAIALLALSGVMMGLYAALFAANYMIF